MQENSSNKDLYWINAVKAVCMICVYWAHSEAYCPVSQCFTIVPWIGPFYVNAFFVASGYLFFYSMSRVEQKNFLLRKGQNIIFRLLIPTLLFSSLIFIPKFLFYSAEISFRSYCYYVLGGVSFWFTSALAVTQVIMLGCFGLFRKKLFVHLSAALFLLTAVILSRDICPSNFPWYWRSGLSGCFLFVLGGFYYRYEPFFDRFQRYIMLSALVAIILITLVGKKTPIWVMMGCHFNISGFGLMLASSVLLFQLMKKMPYQPILDYIGKNSILFYFFSGVTPALCGTLWRKLLPGTTDYWLIIVAVGAELLSGWLISLCVNKNAPFLLDVRNLFLKRA